MVKATLGFKVEAGTERGGEDVSLLVRLESEVEPAALLSDEALEALKAQLRDEYGSSDEDAEVRLTDDGEGEVVRTQASSDYEFRVEESAETLFADLKKLVEEGDWNFNRRRKVWWVEQELYRQGNAD